MILYEHEGKKLLEQAGINIPRGQILNQVFDREAQTESVQDDITVKPPYVLKAQVLSGKRADAGGILRIRSGQVEENLKELFDKTINGEKVDKVLVEEMVEYDGPEYYVSISYDTETRGPVLTLSIQGGTGVEERDTQLFQIDPITQKCTAVQQNVISNEVVEKLIKLFFDTDLLLLEINPLVKSKSGEWIALDAKIKLDDSAIFRHPEWSASDSTELAEVWRTPRSAPGHSPTKNEIEAKKIDEGDYRGVAGSTYFDLPGDIAILSSGGGVSLTAMDALIAAGGKPANFTEYSGNPPKEKVTKLTKIVLDKPGINGLWVIGTVAANFTDIFETLSGFIEGLRELKSQGVNLNFPIVIRRGGPRDREAFKMLEQIKDFNLTLQGEEISIAQSAQIMAQKAREYAATT